MTRIDQDDPAVVIIGSGAGGGTLAHELTRRGVPVVLLEAGAHIGTEEFVNDEWDAFGQLAWLDPRTSSGSWRIARDFPHLPAWVVKSVGGSTTHWAGSTPRILEHELQARSTYGDVPGAQLLDWPLTLAELAPYYDRAEIALGSSHRHGRPALPANNNYTVFATGAARVGYNFYATGPTATNAAPYDGRPGTTQGGFNFEGDQTHATWSTLVREIPRAEATGNLDLRPNSQAVQITHDRHGRADGVLYLDVHDHVHRQRTRVVAVAGNAIETPRLLLLSASAQFPDGLANSSGQLGRHYMRHTTGAVFARFERPVHFYRGETMAGVIADEARHDPERGFVGGYYLQTLALGPAFLAAFADPGAWGRDFTRLLDGYDHTAGLWIVGEDMPRAGNRVTLNQSVTDTHGLPVANVHVDEHPNDDAMRRHAYQQAELLYDAVGALSVHRTPPFPSMHNLGTARMSVRPADGVTNSYGRTHDVPNLFVSDGSVFTTSTSASPTLTIVALAMRQADYILDLFARGQL